MSSRVIRSRPRATGAPSRRPPAWSCSSSCSSSSSRAFSGPRRPRRAARAPASAAGTARDHLGAPADLPGRPGRRELDPCRDGRQRHVPPRAGRPSGGAHARHLRRWKVVERSTLTRTGRVEFSARSRVSGQAVRYRVTALPYQRLAQGQHRRRPLRRLGGPGLRRRVRAAPGVWTRAGDHRIQFYNPWGGRSCSKGSPERDLRPGRGAPAQRAWPTRGHRAVHTVRRGRHPARHRPARVPDQRARLDAALRRLPLRRRRGADAVPADPRPHASFWLQPRGLLRYGTTPWGAEIDVVEWYGADDRRGGMTSAVYRPTPTGAKVADRRPLPRHRLVPGLAIGSLVAQLPRVLGGVDADGVRLPHRRARDLAYLRGRSRTTRSS